MNHLEHRSRVFHHGGSLTHPGALTLHELCYSRVSIRDEILSADPGPVPDSQPATCHQVPTPPLLGAGSLFLSFFLREEGTDPVYFQIPLHLIHGRLAFAVKAENYKEGLIDPPVSLKKPVLWSLIDPLGTYGTMNESSGSNGGR